jgi:hypothetical protein
MRYFVYENWQAGPHKAVIHRGTCGHCNEGRGRAGGYDRAHAQWHPDAGAGFATPEDAWAYARSLRGVEVTSACGHCRPGPGA